MTRTLARRRIFKSYPTRPNKRPRLLTGTALTALPRILPYLLESPEHRDPNQTSVWACLPGDLFDRGVGRTYLCLSLHVSKRGTFIDVLLFLAFHVGFMFPGCVVWYLFLGRSIVLGIITTIFQMGMAMVVLEMIVELEDMGVLNLDLCVMVSWKLVRETRGSVLEKEKMEEQSTIAAQRAHCLKIPVSCRSAYRTSAILTSPVKRSRPLAPGKATDVTCFRSASAPTQIASHQRNSTPSRQE